MSPGDATENPGLTTADQNSKTTQEGEVFKQLRSKTEVKLF